MAKYRFLLVAALMVLAAATKASAGVVLNFLDNDGTDSGWLGASGATFVLTLNISSSESTTGLNYYLRSVNGNSIYTITARDTTTSAYPFVYNSDAAVAQPTVNALNPDNDMDLGASVNDVNVANVPGTYQVAKYTFRVAPGTVDGTYAIQSFSNSGTGWVGAAPDFNEAAFNQHASYSIRVATPQWNRDGGGTWSTTVVGANLNWSDNITPAGTSATANFLNRITAPSTVTTDANKSLQTMNIDSPISYTIARSGGTISMQGTNPSINVLSGSHSIQAFFTWLSAGSALRVSSGASVVMSGTINWTVGGTVNVDPGASATISGTHTITGGTTVGQVLTKTGAGTLTISGPQTPGANAVFAAAGGITNLNSTIGTTATATAASVANMFLRVNTGTAEVNLGADMNLRGVTVSYLDAGTQGLDLNSPATANAFRSLRVYGTDMAAAKTALWAAIMNATINPGDGIFDSGISATVHPNSRVAIAILPDAHNDQSILIRPAVIGDLNLDNQVTIADFITLASHFDQVGTWQEGDINADGSVTIADFIALASSFGQSYAGDSIPVSASDRAILAGFAAANVPEPGFVGVLGVAVGILVGRRRHSPPRNRS